MGAFMITCSRRVSAFSEGPHGFSLWLWWNRRQRMRKQRNTTITSHHGDEDLDDVYLNNSSRNRRWGDNGYVRAGRQEARPSYHPNHEDSGAGPSRRAEKKETKEAVGRRAKRALKREAADKAAAAKHQQHLARLGRVQVCMSGVKETSIEPHGRLFV